ncbi:MAG: sterol desaturase family protein [bacterium]
MDVFAPDEIYFYDAQANEWVFLLSLVVLALEAARYLLRKKMSWRLLGDSLANFITYYAVLGIIIATAAAYVGGYYYVHDNFALADLPLNGWSIAACIVLADLAYYCEHRATHRIGIGWATHTVHHSSPHFNLSVAYRFGPLDAFVPFVFHLPLLLIGFDPAVVLLSESIVLLYQTFLHTEAVGKLPKPIEAVMNTPSHHRVHHGANPQYIDKNYAGIFIVWDKLFATFAEENEKVVYGITDPIHSVNPLVVFFHGLTRLARQVATAKGIRNKAEHLIRPPGWMPHESS